MGMQGTTHMKHAYFLILSFLFLISCQQEQNTLLPEEQAMKDSTALHVAVIPVMDCLPIYYAERMQMFQSEGVDVRLTEWMYA